MTAKGGDRGSVHKDGFYETGVRITQARLSAQALTLNPNDLAMHTFAQCACFRLTSAIGKLPIRIREDFGITAASRSLAGMASGDITHPQAAIDVAALVDVIATSMSNLALKNAASSVISFELGMLVADGSGSLPDEPVLRDPETGKDCTVWAGPPGYGYDPVYPGSAPTENAIRCGLTGTPLRKMLVEWPKPKWRWRKPKELQSRLRSLGIPKNSLIARYTDTIVENDQFLPSCPTQFWKWRFIEVRLSQAEPRTRRRSRGRPKSPAVAVRRKAIKRIIVDNPAWKDNPFQYARQILAKLKENKKYKDVKVTIEHLRKDLKVLGHKPKQPTESD